MPFARRSRRTSRKSTSRRPKKMVSFAPRRATKSATVALIKNVIARETETKFRSELILDRVGFNSQPASSGDIIRLLPKLVQGQGDTASYEREGMKINVRSLRITSEFSLTQQSSLASTAIAVCYYVLQAKDIRDTAAFPGTINLGKLLRTGDAVETQSFNGFVQDWMLPVNPARFSVLKKGSFLLGKNTGQIQDSTAAGNQPLAGQAVKRTLNFSLKCPKHWTYDEDTNTPRTVYYPKGYAPFMLIGYYHQDQTSPDVLNTDLTVTMRSNLLFDDA